jgi:nicotinamide phosphoribosyltransferase
LKGLLCVKSSENGDLVCLTEQTWEQENQGWLQTIYEDGKFYNQTTLEEVRNRLK